MTIELMHAEGEIPIIIGDDDDIALVVGIEWPSDEAITGYLLLRNGDKEPCRFPLPYFQNPFEGDYAVVAAMGEDDLVHARLEYRDGSPCQPIDIGQLEVLFRLIIGKEAFRAEIL